MSGQQLAQKAGKLHVSGKFAQAEKIYKKLLKANPNDLTLIRILGMLERDRKNQIGALKWFELGLQVSGRNPTFLAEIALTKLNQGNVKDAFSISSEAFTAAPTDLSIAVLYAKLCLAHGLVLQAVDAIEGAIESNPTNYDALLVLTTAIVQTGILPVPLDRIQQLVRLHPNDAKAHATLGTAHRLNGNFELALSSLDRALAIDANNHEAVASKAEVLTSLDKVDEAIQTTQSIEKSNSAIVCLAESRAFAKLGKFQDALDSLSNLRLNTLSPHLRSSVQMAQGKLLDKLKLYKEAWAKWRDANGLHEGTFDIEKHKKTVLEIKNTPFKKYAQHQSSQPIFIVGMYRSGTTLLEQILSSHSQIDAAGEVDEVLRFAKEVPYPECATDPNPDWANRYLQRLNSDFKYCTDKMPLNYLHIGLIKSIFPNAKILHTTRNPLDTFVSCYSNTFTKVHAFTSNIEHFGTVYECYLDIMKHWRTLYPEIFEVNYETLISDFEGTIQTVISRLGLDFEENCLTFFKNRKVSQTPSIDQVRQPIYLTSINRWTNYEQELGAIKFLQQ